LCEGKARVITVNNSFKLYPDADILYACDYAWWEHHKGAPDFSGLKLSIDCKAVSRPWGVRQVGINKKDDRLELVRRGTVGWAGNGGFHALNLAVQMHPGKIVLVGFDMRIDHGLHWHGAHPSGMNNPSRRNVERWRRCIDDAAAVISRLGISVINASPISALQEYEKMTFEEALSC